MQVKSLFISALLSPLPDTLASAITPHDGLEHIRRALDTDTALDGDLAAMLLSGPPRSCSDMPDNAQALPESCIAWSNAIEKHNLSANMTAVWAANPPEWHPMQDDPDFSPDDRAIEDEMQSKYPAAIPTVPASLERRHGPGGPGGPMMRPCPDCNNRKRLLCCGLSGFLIPIKCCMKLQTFCCKKGGCECGCEGKNDCKKKHLDGLAGPGKNWGGK